jgi:hypothetical protein
MSWYNGSFPVSYSFTVANMPAINAGMQVQLWLVPLNSVSSNDVSNPYGDDDIDSNATNALALVINDTLTGTNNNYGETLLYKTNAPGASLNPGAAAPVVNLATNFSTTVQNASSGNGTWTLVFTDNSDGYITGPGLSQVPFSMSPSDAALFNSPMVAYFGIQPNGLLAIGDFVDFLNITINNGANSINDNFAAGTGLGNWTTVGGIAYSNGVWQVPPGSAYWIDWTTPADGFDVEVNSSLSTAADNNWINPAYYDSDYATNLVEIVEGGNIWTLLSTNDLPETTNAFFRLHNPPNYIP